jgi:integrase/recombinase XerD
MTSIKFNLDTHKGLAVIFIQFEKDEKIIARLKEIASPKWSRTRRSWYVLDTPKMREIFKLPQEVNIEKNTKTNERIEVVVNKKKQHQFEQLLFKKEIKIPKINSHILPKMHDMLLMKGYSISTQRTYLNEMSIFLEAIKGNAADTFTPERLQQYFIYCHTTLQLSENTIHSRMNAIKFYYEQILKNEKMFFDIPRPLKPLKLPKVISEEKIIKGLFTLENLKHRTLLFVSYSAGLRVSEVVKIKLTDIDKDRMQIFVEAAKGKKDRVVVLAKSALQLIDLYMEEYKPSFYLFEGQNKAEHYSIRSAQTIFKLAFKELGLDTRVSFHSLRHSYATHLLDNGTDISYIQHLLGHNDIKTTLIYADVSYKKTKTIESPIDRILREKTTKGK